MRPGALLSAALCGAALWGTSACAGAAGTPGPGAVAPAEDETLVPPGYGTLRQDDISLTVRDGDVRVKVTPLAEAIIRTAAPDTYARLRRLAELHAGNVADQAGVERPALFLVSFFSRSQDAAYEPEDVHLISRGVRHRPLAVRPVTGGWGSGRLGQEEPQMAVYGFGSSVDLESDLTVEYRGVADRSWSRILAEVRAERERIRARAGDRRRDAGVESEPERVRPEGAPPSLYAGFGSRSRVERSPMRRSGGLDRPGSGGGGAPARRLRRPAPWPHHPRSLRRSFEDRTSLASGRRGHARGPPPGEGAVREATAAVGGKRGRFGKRHPRRGGCRGSANGDRPQAGRRPPQSRSYFRILR